MQLVDTVNEYSQLGIYAYCLLIEMLVWSTMLTYDDTIICGLLFERICDGADCPMKPAHSLPPGERLDWIENLSAEDKSQILDHYYLWIRKLDRDLL